MGAAIALARSGDAAAVLRRGGVYIIAIACTLLPPTAAQ